jgi:hypothetical protein
MPTPEEIQERTLKLQEAEHLLKRDQFERDAGKGILSNASVLVTVIAGMSAVIFQGLNYRASIQQAEAAKANLEAASKQSQNEWDFRGLQLFVAVQEKIITCDADGNTAQLNLFTDLFPNLRAGFRNAAAARANSCATKQAEAARETAEAQRQSPGPAADAARYRTLGALSATIAAATATVEGTAAPQAALTTVYLQIASESQRPDAVRLQQALRAQGYKVPGIELTSTAPNEAQVRYFYATQTDTANQVADLVGRTLNGPKPTTVSLAGRYRNLPGGVMEFWFPRPGPA